MGEILVVPKEVLFRDKSFSGFLKAEDMNYISNILAHCIYKERDENLERDESLQQIVSYIWILNKQKGMVYLYKKGEKTSGGVGGHIDKNYEEDEADPISSAMMKELSEEVAIKEYGTPKVVGYIKDDKDNIGKFHMGIVAILDTPHEVFSMDDMKRGMFYTVDEAEKVLKEGNVENWTEISWPFIREYLVK